MGSPCSLVFQVKRQQPEFITPAKPTPHEKKLLSEIDIQEGLRFQTPFILSYKNNNPSMKRKDPVEVIRDALRRALVYYYPFAGRVREGCNGKLMVDCNEEGILFVEADADVTLELLEDSLPPPCPFLEDFLLDVPGSDDILGTPLLLVQVSTYICQVIYMLIKINRFFFCLISFVIS